MIKARRDSLSQPVPSPRWPLVSATPEGGAQPLTSPLIGSAPGPPQMQYLGAKKEKKRIAKPSEKMKFVFDWCALTVDQLFYLEQHAATCTCSN